MKATVTHGVVSYELSLSEIQLRLLTALLGNTASGGVIDSTHMYNTLSLALTKGGVTEDALEADGTFVSDRATAINLTGFAK